MNYKISKITMPISILSIVLGFRYKKRRLNSDKNITIGVIML